MRTLVDVIHVAQWLGIAYLIALPTLFILWFLRDHFKFSENDKRELDRLMGAYDGMTPVEGTDSATHRKSRSPFARPRPAPKIRVGLPPGIGVIQLDAPPVEETEIGSRPGK